MAVADLPQREQRALSRFVREVRAVFGARLADVRLFGSAARGDYGPDSDLDVLVLIDGMTHEDLALTSRLASDAGLDEDVLISPLPMATDHLARLRRTEQRLARDIDTEGVPL